MRIAVRFGLILLVLGVMFVYLGLKERSVSAQASHAPEKISLARLLARETDGNPNVILTNFVPCDDYVYEQDNTRWTGAWVPVIPDEGVEPGRGHAEAPKQVQALIFSINAHNEMELYNRCTRPELPALVVNKIVSLKSDQKKLLQEKYPGTDFEKCLIIQEGREPAGDTKLLVMIGGGGLAALAGLCLTGFFVFGLITKR